VLHRVLHQRLQDQVGHQRVHHPGFHLGFHLERSLEADAHDLQVAVHELDLLAQRDLRLARAFQRVAQELAEARDHPPHAARVALDQRGHGVQRVEQEVRVDLAAQRRQPRLGQLGAELRGFGLQARGLVLPGAVAVLRVARHAGGHDPRVHDHLAQEPQVRDAAQRVGEEVVAVRRGQQRAAHDVEHRVHHHRHGQAGDDHAHQLRPAPRPPRHQAVA